MQKRDRWSSLALFLFGTLIWVESLKLGLGRMAAPGPGFLPLLAGVALCLFSIGTFVVAGNSKGSIPKANGKFFFYEGSKKIVSLVFLSLICFNCLWELIGFSLTSFIFLGFLFWVVGKRNWKVSLMSSAIISFLAYVLFQLFLEAQLPTGYVGF